MHIGFVGTVPKPHRLNWMTYRPSSSDGTYALRPLPAALQSTLSEAFQLGQLLPDADLSELRKQLTANHWICYACCEGVVTANAFTVRVVETRQAKGQAFGEAEQSCTGEPTELRLRRHLKHKHAVLNSAGAIEWRPGPAPHTKGCPEIEGKSLVLRPSSPTRLAPEIREGNPADWSYTYQPRDKPSDILVGRRDYDRPAADPASNPLLHHPARTQLMTLLYRAGLLFDVTRQGTMVTEWAAMQAAVDHLDQGRSLPPMIRACRNYVLGSNEPFRDGAVDAKISALIGLRRVDAFRS